MVLDVVIGWNPVGFIFVTFIPEFRLWFKVELRPRLIPELSPELRLELRLELRPKFNAEFSPELSPELIPELSPELIPEFSNPEMLLFIPEPVFNLSICCKKAAAATAMF